MSGDSQNELILQLLAEARAEAATDRRAIEGKLSELSAQQSGLQASAQAQSQQLAEMRAENRAELQILQARMSKLEEQAAAIPHTSDRIRALEDRVGAVSAAGDRRHLEVDQRLRVLEGENRETGVFRRAASFVTANLLRWGLPLVGGAIGAALMSGKIPL